MFREAAIETYDRIPSAKSDAGTYESMFSRLPAFGVMNYWDLATGYPIPDEFDDPEDYKREVALDLVVGWKERLGQPAVEDSYFIADLDGSPLIYVERRYPDCTLRLQYYVHFNTRNRRLTAYRRGAVYSEKPVKMPKQKRLLIGGVAVACILRPILLVPLLFLWVILAVTRRHHEWVHGLRKVSPRDTSSMEPIVAYQCYNDSTVRPWLDETFNDLDTVALDVLSQGPSHSVESRPPPSFEDEDEEQNAPLFSNGYQPNTKPKGLVARLKKPAIALTACVVLFALWNKGDDDPPANSNPEVAGDPAVPGQEPPPAPRPETEEAFGQNPIVGSYMKNVDIPSEEIVKLEGDNRMFLHFEKEIEDDLKIIIRDDFERSFKEKSRARWSVDHHPLISNALDVPKIGVMIEGVEIFKQPITVELIDAYEKVRVVEDTGLRASLAKLMHEIHAAGEDKRAAAIPEFGEAGMLENAQMRIKGPDDWDDYAKKAASRRFGTKDPIKAYDRYRNPDLKGFDSVFKVAEFKMSGGVGYFGLSDSWKAWRGGAITGTERAKWTINSARTAVAKKSHAATSMLTSKYIFTPVSLLDFDSSVLDIEKKKDATTKQKIFGALSGKPKGWHTRIRLERVSEDKLSKGAVETRLLRVFTLDGEWKVLIGQRTIYEVESHDDALDADTYGRGH